VREYDLIADWYAVERVDQTGVSEALALAGSLRPGSRILDLGCGNGRPLTQALCAAGHRLVGLDRSAAMLARFQRTCPATPAVRALVQAIPFVAGAFDAAVAWGVWFHLPPADAVAAFRSVARVLRPGAPFLFTAGDVESLEPHTDTMNGVTFRYFSFSQASYRRMLADHGLTLVDVHTDAGGNTYYRATKG